MFKITPHHTTFILSLGLVLGSVVYAWTGPSAQASNGNVPPPINTGPTAQTKQGGLGLGTDILPGEMLRVLGDATFTNKAYSSPTIDSDAPSSLVTKSYVDGKVLSGPAGPQGPIGPQGPAGPQMQGSWCGVLSYATNGNGDGYELIHDISCNGQSILYTGTCPSGFTYVRVLGNQLFTCIKQ